jgi:hypothetical protein
LHDTHAHLLLVIIARRRGPRRNAFLGRVHSVIAALRKSREARPRRALDAVGLAPSSTRRSVPPASGFGETVPLMGPAKLAASAPGRSKRRVKIPALHRTVDAEQAELGSTQGQLAKY